MPMKTPVLVPAILPGAMPASSIASYVTSMSTRCCGSARVASRGDMPKNEASNWSTPLMKPPRRAYVLPGAAGSGS
jgi:hypothetical protein